MKKILSVLLCVVMSASMLSGCKKDSVSDTKPAPAPAVPAFEEVRDYLIDNTKNNDGMYSKLIDIDSDTYDFMLSYDEDEEELVFFLSYTSQDNSHKSSSMLTFVEDSSSFDYVISDDAFTGLISGKSMSSVSSDTEKLSFTSTEFKKYKTDTSFKSDYTEIMEELAPLEISSMIRYYNDFADDNNLPSANELGFTKF